MNGRDRIAWNLRHLRLRQGLTQESLSVDAAVDRTSISYIENGTFNPSIDLLDRLAKALSVDVAEFLKVPANDAQQAVDLPRGPKPNS